MRNKLISVRRRFEAMITALERNERVAINSVAFKDPAHTDEIHSARQAAGGTLPAGVEGFFAEMNGFSLEWEHTIPSIKEHSDADKGLINILPIGEIFTDVPGRTWFDGSGGDIYRPIKPIDLFTSEACAAFYQPAGQSPEATICFHYFGEGTCKTGYTFVEYVERLLAARGFWYWIQTLCAETQDNPEVAAFRQKMPLIFDDYDDRLFQPRGASAPADDQ